MLDLPVPDPGPPGPFATMSWLRATVSRFANGETHARRRALTEARLATLDPAELAATAKRARRAAAAPPDLAGPPHVAAAPQVALAAPHALAAVPRP